MGAPIAVKTTNPDRRGLTVCYDLFEGRFVANDPDDVVVNFNSVDDRTKIGLTKGDFSGRNVFPHRASEAFNGFGIDNGREGSLGFDAFKRSLRAITFKLESGQSFAKHVVDLGDAFLDHLIKPREFLLGVGDLSLEGGNPAIDLKGLLGTSFCNRGQERCQPFGMEKLLNEIAGDQGIKFLHRNGAALAARLSLPSAGEAGIISVDLICGPSTIFVRGRSQTRSIRIRFRLSYHLEVRARRQIEVSARALGSGQKLDAALTQQMRRDVFNYKEFQPEKDEVGKMLKDFQDGVEAACQSIINKKFGKAAEPDRLQMI